MQSFLRELASTVSLVTKPQDRTTWGRSAEIAAMKARFTVALVLLLSGIPGGEAWGQRFRFVPIPRPAPFRLPIRPPIHSPFHPPIHPPFHPPTSAPQDTDSSPPNQPSGGQAAPADISIFLLVCFGIGLAALLIASIGIVTGTDNIALLKILVAPVIGLLKLLVAPLAAMKKLHLSGGLIRIISTPPGEADRSIREAWVGLDLPLAKTKDQGQQLAAMEVLSWKQDCMTGYAVEGRTAIKHLAAHSPEAAAWWRENVPHVLDSRYQFIFPVENCQKVD